MIRRLKNTIHTAIAIFANIRHGFPSRGLKIIAVTGTSGKTTVSHLIYAMLCQAGKKVALISTIEARIGTKSLDTGFHVTMPDAHTVQKLLKQSVNEGMEFVVLEMTSHGLDQSRGWGIKPYVSVITNITHEHLDYHKSIEHYRSSKAKILKGSDYAVLNQNNTHFEYLKNQAGFAKIIIFPDNNDPLADIELPQGLWGEFNRENILAAASVVRIFDVSNETIKKTVSTFQGIPGRMEEIKNQKGFRIIMDFAHKPDALEKVLQSEKSHNLTGRIIVMFGCAGLRDVAKRSMMGGISARYADIAIFTAEDPRTEDVRDIIEMIAQGALKEGMSEVKKRDWSKDSGALLKNKIFFRIPDRQEAINFAIRKVARNSDTILFLGKGHETSICYGKIEYPWNERESVLKALA